MRHLCSQEEEVTIRGDSSDSWSGTCRSPVPRATEDRVVGGEDREVTMSRSCGTLLPTLKSWPLLRERRQALEGFAQRVA